ncbi:MAG: TrmJ/YjtD family RNA methyltransferase [Treponema sp.]|jgi:tRNA/rRNA methyltransferase/tRNA (cytidine32/uridine32-2'-O)-methyltransferase|nr:TrmJ/YjtD family RNA methyltransferase [Treponema sp.]
MILSDIKIILCRASEPGNIGAVCRAMKNMGLSGLRLTASNTLDTKSILKRAVHAQEIWENAGVFNSLAEAAADCSLIVGTTRRRGRNRKSVSMDPRTLAEWLSKQPGPAAIVFGNERTGLEESELELCNIASHIPASGAQPSLNLSHAVQIYAYELFRAIEPQTPVKGEWTAMNREEVSALVASITDTLAGLGFYKKPGREMQTRFLRDVVSRSGLTDREGKYLKDIFVKAARLSSINP